MSRTTESARQGLAEAPRGDRLRIPQGSGGLWTAAIGAAVAVLLVQGASPLLAREPNASAPGDASAVQSSQGALKSVTVAINQSRVIKLRTTVARVSVANPEIADLLVLDPQQVYVVGKKIGTTNMMLWDDKEKLSGSLLLEVTPDLDQLKTRLHQVMPNERVQVRAAQGTIVVSGEVSSPTKAEAAIRLAESYAGTGGAGAQGAGAGAGGATGQSPILNMLQVGGSQQVMLEVKVAELNREVNKSIDGNVSVFYNGSGVRMGTVGESGGAFPLGTPYPFQQTTTERSRTKNVDSNWSDTRDSNWDTNSQFTSNTSPATTATATPTSTTVTTASPANTITNVGAAATGALAGLVTNTASALASTATTSSTYSNPFVAFPSALGGRGLFSTFMSGSSLVNATLEAAKSRGEARILAEPNLTTLSGQEAKFHAGGEYPYQVQQPSQGGTTVFTNEFKEYGIGLNFIPVVLDSGVISLKVNVKASELDYKNMNIVTRNPALRSRSANATVEIKAGETISIAGLISEDLRDASDKFPLLGDLPILGMLFRSQGFQKRQTELVIFVTPRLANSFDPKKAKLPTAGFVEPTDLEFYLLGRTQGRKPKADNVAPARKDALGPDKSGSEGAFGHDL